MASDSSTPSDVSHSSPLQSSNLFSTPPHAQLSFSLKLKETNYLAWKTQFLPIIKCYNLNRHIDGTTEPTPIITNSTTSQPEPNPEYLKWIQEDQLLLSWICSSLTEEVMPYVTGLESAFDAWNSLSEAFGTSNSAKRVQLHIALQNLSLGDKTISLFLREAKVIADELAAAGTPISTDEFNATIFRLLPSDYHPVIATLSASKTKVPFSDLSAQLMSHEILLQSSNRSTTTTPILANFSRQTQSGSRSNQRGPNARGSGSNSKGSKRWFPNPCQICGLNNHQAKWCRKRYDQDSTPITANTATTMTSADSTTWFADSAASHHMTPDLSALEITDEYKGPDKVTLGNGSDLDIQHIGNRIIQTPAAKLHLNNILHVPTLQSHLLSVNQFAKDNDCTFKFDSCGFVVKHKPSKRVLITGPAEDGIYKFRFPPPVSHPTAMVSARTTQPDWHSRLGHPQHSTVSFLISKFNLPHSSIKQSSNSLCEACCLGKSKQLTLPLTGTIANKPLALVHGDVWGPAPELSFYGDRYFVIFVDDFSRYCWLFPIKKKSDVCSVFINFHKLVERQFQTPLLEFQSDWGGEFRTVHNYLKEQGVHHRITCPHTHQQNGTVERKIRHVVDTCLALLAHSSVPKRFWNFAMSTAVFLINRLPTSVLQNISPYQRLFCKAPAY